MTTITVCGASGLVGSNIVKLALARGYTVKGTLRDATDQSKVPYLMALPGAEERLTLFSAESTDSRSFDAAMEGSDAVFIACFPPIYNAADGTPGPQLDRERGYAELVAPVRDGCENVLLAAQRAGIRNVMLCSSTSSTNPPEGVEVKTETNAVSDAEFQMSEGKYVSAEKIVMETMARDFCVRHNMRLCIFLPTLMLGPVVLPQHYESNSTQFIARPVLEGKPFHEVMPKGSASAAHVEDVAALFLNAYEKPEARGRYFAVYRSWPWPEIYEEFRKVAPEMEMPRQEGPAEEPTLFDFTRRDSLGVPMRDLGQVVRETADWVKTRPFG